MKKKHKHPLYSSRLSKGQKAADSLTKFAGSWTFIIIFILFLGVWICVNLYFLINLPSGPFDPYPFILLNLILSCLAAIQAPVILMSQNRQTQRDRLRTEYDYKIDRKTEREVRQIMKDIKKIKKKLKI